MPPGLHVLAKLVVRGCGGFFFVLVVSIVCTIMISIQAPWFGIGHVFLVQALYGLAAIPVVYLIALMTKSQPAAFASSVLAMAIMYIISIVAFTVSKITRPFKSSIYPHNFLRDQIHFNHVLTLRR